MKIKRFIAFFIGLSLLPAFASAEEMITATEVSIAEVQTDDRFHLFKALGIVTNYEDENDFFYIPYVSRGEYCRIMVRLINDEVPADASVPFIDISENSDKDAIAYLYNSGVVSGVGEEEFCPELAITVEHAAIIASRMLGYDFFVNNYPETSYIDVAQKYKLLKNISGDIKEAITKTQLLTLLENVINAEPFGMNISGEGPLYGINDNGTILEMSRKIYKTKGVMTENIYTNELGIKTNERCTIVVDDIEYLDDDYQDKTDFLGKYVELYYKEEDGERTALYIIPNERKTNEVIIPSEMIREPIDIDVLKYVSEGKLKEAKLSRALKVIYNGVAYTDYSLPELKPKYGELRLVDSDDDRVFDYAFVTSYQLMWLERYSALDKKFYSKLSGGATEVYVNDTQPERNLYIEADGKKSDRFGVTQGDVLLVAESRNEGDKLIKMFASSAIVEGVLSQNSINDYGERELLVDGMAYLMNPDTAELYERGDNTLANLELGRSYLFYIDAKGRIAAFVKAESDYELYGYAVQYYSHEDEDKYSVKVFNENGEWKRYYFAEKLRVDSTQVKDEVAYGLLAPGGVSSRSMVKLRLINEEIKQIQTPVTSSEYIKDKLTTSGIQEFMYVGTTKNLGDKYFFNSDAKIFVIPASRNADESDYYICGSEILKTETVKYNMEVYDADEFGHSSIFKLETSAGSAGLTKYPYHVVRKITQALNEDDEVIGVLNCAADGEDEVIYYGKNASTFNGLSVGDVIQLDTDFHGRVLNYSLIYDRTMFGSLYDDGQPDMYNISIDIRGYVQDLDSSRYVIKIDIGSNQVLIKSNSAPNVVIVEHGEVKIGTFNDINPRDYIVGRVAYGQLSDVVVIRN